MNDSSLAEGAEQPVAAPHRWPHAPKSERREADELFEKLRTDVHADDELLRLLEGTDPRHKLIAALAALRLATFTPHRWSPDERGDGQNTQRKEGRHFEVLTALEAIYNDGGASPRLRAATVLAIAEIERHLAPTRKRKTLFPIGLDPHARHLVGWLTSRAEERRLAALWALSLIAPLFSTSTVELICDSLEPLFAEPSGIEVWAAAAKLASCCDKRARRLAPSLLARLNSGAGEAGCEIIDALFSVGHAPADRESMAANLTGLLLTTKDPRRLWLCVVSTRSFGPKPSRFFPALREVANGEGHAAIAAKEILGPLHADPDPCPIQPSPAHTGVGEYSCASA